MPTLTPVGVDFADTAPRTIVVDQVVAAPAAPIWAAIVDNSSWTVWYPTMRTCVSTSDPDHGVGSTRRVVVGSLRAEEKFVAWDPERTWAFTILETNLPLAKRFLERLDLIPGDGVTAVRYTGAFEPTAFTRPIAGLIERQVRTAWTNGLAGLARHVAPAD